jgi:hypothetical protein
VKARGDEREERFEAKQRAMHVAASGNPCRLAHGVRCREPLMDESERAIRMAFPLHPLNPTPG